MLADSGDGFAGFTPPRTRCPSASRTTAVTAPLTALYGLQTLFIMGLMLLGTGWAAAFGGAAALLVVDLVATSSRAGLRQLATQWAGGPLGVTALPRLG